MAGENESNLEKQMKAAADTVLASLGGDEKLQGRISSAVSPALGAGLKPLMDQLKPSPCEEEHSYSRNPTGGKSSFPRMG